MWSRRAIQKSQSVAVSTEQFVLRNVCTPCPADEAKEEEVCSVAAQLQTGNSGFQIANRRRSRDRSSSNGRSAVKLQSNRSRIVVVTTA